MRATAQVVAAVLGAMLAACPAPKGEPALSLTLTPKNVTDATPVKVRVVGTTGDGKVGSGTVKITSARGSLTTPAEVQLDTFGSATAELICDPTTEPGCSESVRVVAEWTSDGVLTSAEARLNSGGSGTGGGTGTGTGGGTGAGGGSAAGGGTAAGGGAGGGLFGSLAGSVLLYGTLREGRSDWDAVAAINSPAQSRVGFSPKINTSTRPLAVKPTGELLYWRSESTSTSSINNVYQFVEDSMFLGSDGGWQYPTTPEQNDVEIPMPCGVAYVALLLRPDNGSLVWKCGTVSSGHTYYENGARLDVGADAGTFVFRVIPGASGIVLRWDASGLALREANGVVMPPV